VSFQVPVAEPLPPVEPVEASSCVPPLEPLAEVVDQEAEYESSTLPLFEYELSLKPVSMPLCEPLEAIQAVPLAARFQCVVMVAVAAAWPLEVPVSVLVESSRVTEVLLEVTPPAVEVEDVEAE
jgi:hypothetical protein